MKKFTNVMLFLFCFQVAYTQTFSLIGNFGEDAQALKKISDSLQKPFLISGPKVYVFDCVGGMIGGDENDRNSNADKNDRIKNIRDY